MFSSDSEGPKALGNGLRIVCRNHPIKLEDHNLLFSVTPILETVFLGGLARASISLGENVKAIIPEKALSKPSMTCCLVKVSELGIEAQGP